MLGAKRRRTEKLFHYGFRLEDRIPEDHVLRRIAEVVDFSFVREAVREKYGQNGHRSEDPIVLMKLMFLLFFEDVKSERELMRTLPMRLDWLWFCGFDIDEDVPNHSVLSKARARWGVEAFEELFVRIVGQCVDAGLVGGEKLHMDGSLIEADAAKSSYREGPPALIRALKEAYGVTEQKLSNDGWYKPKNEGVVSTTDPDSSWVTQNAKSPSRFRYKNHRAVDDRQGVITATETTPGDISENSKLPDLVEEHEKHTQRRVSTVVADSQYGTNANFAYCGHRKIHSHMANLSKSHRNRPNSEGIFGRDQFDYDPINDHFTCPAGQLLTARKFKQKFNAMEYRAGTKVCKACALKTQCTRSSLGRVLRRHLDQDLIDQARVESSSRQAYRDRLRRMYLMEGSFADAANNHHLKRARWRRLWRQQIQGYLIATCQNVRILLRNLPKQPLNANEAVYPAINPPRPAPLTIRTSFFHQFRRPLTSEKFALIGNC